MPNLNQLINILSQNLTMNSAFHKRHNNKGRIEVGLDADLTLWDIERPADLAYQMGLNPIEGIMVGGQWRG